MRWYAFGLALALAACSSGFGTMDRIMRSWEGQPLDAVIGQWGYPHQEQIVAGRKLYHWQHNRAVPVPATTSGTITRIGDTAFINTSTSGGGTAHYGCTRTIEVDERNIVIGWQWNGNGCPFMDVALGYERWQRRP